MMQNDKKFNNDLQTKILFFILDYMFSKLDISHLNGICKFNYQNILLLRTGGAGQPHFLFLVSCGLFRNLRV